MFDKRVFDSDHLGSEKEKESLQYDGWAILARINAQNFSQAIQWVRHTYSGDGTELNEQENEYFLSYGSDDRAIKIIPEKITCKDAPSNKAETFNLIFISDFFGYKRYEEKQHQELFRKILSKIPRKKGYLIKEKKRFPIQE